jgi:two-component system, NtrC family, response regulator GlrR
VEHFLKKFSQQMKKEVKGLAPGVLKGLMLHEWPGNVRELENTIEYAVAMTQLDFITEDFILQAKPAEPSGSPKPFKEAKDSFEREYLSNLLELCEGNVSQAAKMAGKYRADFYDLLKKHNLQTADFKKPG